MKLSTVFVQVALVAAGILVYDQIRGSDPVESLNPEPAVVRVEAPAPEPAPAPIVLEGRGVGVLVDQMKDVLSRISDLETESRNRVTAVADAGYRPTTSEGNAVGTPAEGETYVDENGNTRRFSDDDVAWFRALKGEVDTMERRERYVTMFDRQLERLGIALTDDQKTKVVDETISFRNKIREAGRQAGGQSPEDRRASMDTLREEYSQTVFSLVPTAEAEKIVESMGRYPGYGFRSRDGRARGGGR